MSKAYPWQRRILDAFGSIENSTCSIPEPGVLVSLVDFDQELLEVVHDFDQLQKLKQQLTRNSAYNSAKTTPSVQLEERNDVRLNHY